MKEKIVVKSKDHCYFEQSVKHYKSIGYKENSPRKCGWGEYFVEMVISEK